MNRSHKFNISLPKSMIQLHQESIQNSVVKANFELLACQLFMWTKMTVLLRRLSFPVWANFSDLNVIEFCNTFYVSEEMIPVPVSSKVFNCLMVPETKSSALARSKVALCNTFDSPLVIERTLSNVIRERRKWKVFICNNKPVACVAFIPSLSLPISSSVARMASNV